MARKKRNAVGATTTGEGWSDGLASFECETEKSFGMRQTRAQWGQSSHTDALSPSLEVAWLGLVLGLPLALGGFSPSRKI